MTQEMTQQIPTETEMMTDEQIEEIINKIRNKIHKYYRHKISSYVAKQALDVPNIEEMMFSPFHQYADSFSELILVEVTMNPNCSSQQALDAVNCKQITNSEVVNNAPKEESGSNKVVTFFRPSRLNLGFRVSNDYIEHEFAVRNLKPVSLILLAAVNEADPKFTRRHPNGTQWKDVNGKWCHARFESVFEDGEFQGHHVTVDNKGWGWIGDWLLAGVPITPKVKFLNI
jgi:hypothetical protein